MSTTSANKAAGEEKTGLDNPLSGLYATAPETLPFAPSLEVRAYLLRRERGNLLVYASPHLHAHAPAIEGLGGASRHYLNHGHEAMFAPETPSAPLYVHEGDREPVEKRTSVRATFSRRHHLDHDFEVVPMPGHTPGATAFLWDSGEHRMLFSGDTILLSEGDWITAMLDSSDRDSYIESLELVRELDFDVLVPWAASAGRPFYAITDEADRRQRIDAILRRLRGEVSR